MKENNDCKMSKNNDCEIDENTVHIFLSYMKNEVYRKKKIKTKW